MVLLNLVFFQEIPDQYTWMTQKGFSFLVEQSLPKASKAILDKQRFIEDTMLIIKRYLFLDLYHST